MPKIIMEVDWGDLNWERLEKRAVVVDSRAEWEVRDWRRRGVL